MVDIWVTPAMANLKNTLREECGYEIPIDILEEVQAFPSAIGTRCEPITMFYVEVLSIFSDIFHVKYFYKIVQDTIESIF